MLTCYYYCSTTIIVLVQLQKSVAVSRSAVRAGQDSTVQTVLHRVCQASLSLSQCSLARSSGEDEKIRSSIKPPTFTLKFSDDMSIIPYYMYPKIKWLKVGYRANDHSDMLLIPVSAHFPRFVTDRHIAGSLPRWTIDLLIFPAHRQRLDSPRLRVCAGHQHLTQDLGCNVTRCGNNGRRRRRWARSAFVRGKNSPTRGAIAQGKYTTT